MNVILLRKILLYIGKYEKGYSLRCTMRAPAGTLSVTQILPPIVAPFPMVIRPKIVALEYTITSSSRIG